VDTPHPIRLEPIATADRACSVEAGLGPYSFPQQIWLYPDIRMRITPSYSRAAEVLAVNILALVLQERDYPAWGGTTSSRAVALAKRFFDECLTDLPREAWRIDFDTLEDWIASCEDQERGG